MVTASNPTPLHPFQVRKQEYQHLVLMAAGTGIVPMIAVMYAELLKKQSVIAQSQVWHACMHALFLDQSHTVFQPQVICLASTVELRALLLRNTPSLAFDVPE